MEVLTGFPNYPEGKIYPGYRQSLRFQEVRDGIRIIRVPVYPSHNSSGMARAANYMSFMSTSIVPGLFRIKKPDVVHVYQGPATLALPAMILRLLFKVPFVLDVQDLWPDSVISSGMLKLSGVVGILDFWCRLTYTYAAKIVVLSPGYKKALVARGVEPDKIEVVYNWCDEKAAADEARRNQVHDRLAPNGQLVVVYAGNMGPVQALSAVIDAAGILQEHGSGIRFVLVGDGADVEKLKRRAGEMALKNVEFIPRQSPEMARCFIEEADAVLVHMKDDGLGRMGIPQKTQAYMAAGRPIIMAVKGDASELVLRAHAGIVCDSENPESIASAVKTLSRMPEEERESLGRNGRKFYEEHLSFRIGVRRMAGLFEEIAR